jgi:hypothetical protein
MKKFKLLSILSAMLCVTCSENITPNSEIGVDTQQPFLASIGQLPSSIRGRIASKVFSITDQDCQHTLPAQAKMLIINADAVADVGLLAHSPLVLEAKQKNIPILIGADQALGNKNEIAAQIGGAGFPAANYTLIKVSGANADTTEIIPVGGIERNYLKEEELVSIIKSAIDEEDAEEGDTDELVQTNSVDGTNAATKFTFPSCNFTNKVPYFFWVKNGAYIGLDKQHTPTSSWPKTHRYYRKHKGVEILGQQTERTKLTAGQGQVTFRETKTIAKTKSKSKTWSWKVKVTVTIMEMLSLSAWYGGSKSQTVTYEETFATGATNYSEPCYYACCDMVGFYRTQVNTWHDKVMKLGKSLVRYYYSNDFSKTTDLCYCYTKSNSNPIKFEYDIRSSEPYVSLVFIKINPKCNTKGCIAYTSGSCKGGSIGK